MPRPHFDEHGNRFNPNKVLFDPYAREISHNVLDEAIEACGLDQGVFGTGGAQHCGRPRRELDTGKAAPKGVIVHDDTRPSGKPKAAPEKAAIYEAHIKNLSMHLPRPCRSCWPAYRGSTSSPTSPGTCAARTPGAGIERATSTRPGSSASAGSPPPTTMC